MHLKNDLTKQVKDTDSRTENMKKQYDTSKNNSIDRILSVFTQKEKFISQVAVPLHNNGYFVMIDVIPPSLEITNGEVTIYEYLHTENNLGENMWLAEFFGIYRKDDQLLSKNIYMGIKDMNLDRFKLMNESVDKNILPQIIQLWKIQETVIIVLIQISSEICYLSLKRTI